MKLGYLFALHLLREFDFPTELSFGRESWFLLRLLKSIHRHQRRPIHVCCFWIQSGFVELGLLNLTYLKNINKFNGV